MRFLSFIGTIAIIAGIAAGVFFFGGLFDVSAGYPDPGFVAWALEKTRDASIERHAPASPPNSLDDPATVRTGAREFAAHGCTNCHGGPGVPWAKFSEGLNPGPPDLKDTAKDMKVTEIFWVIKNGIRMTGMPNFGANGMTDDQAWAVAAFVKKLPSVSDADYKGWTTDAK